MDHFPRVLARPSLAALSAGLILAFASHAASSAESCERLEALANQYAGVELTSTQKQFKRKMMVWYATNCTRQARR
jgi:glutaredoxin-related protein